MIPRNSAGYMLKMNGGGSSSALRLKDKRSTRVAVAVVAMLSLVFTMFAGTFTAFADEDQTNLTPFTQGESEGDPPGDESPNEDLGTLVDVDQEDSDPGEGSEEGLRVSSTDEGEAEVAPMAVGDPYFPSTAPGVIYSSTGDGQVYQVTYNASNGTYVRSNFGSKAAGVTSFNGLGISPGADRDMYAYERSGSNVNAVTVYSFNQTNGTWSSTGASVNSTNSGGTVQFIAGAVDANGSFYMGGYTYYGDRNSNNGDAFRLYKYTPGSTTVQYLGYINTSSIAGGTNGDMAFDRQGNLYITRCCGTYGTTVISVAAPAIQGATGGQIPATIAETVGGSQMPSVTGIAFDSSGHMFLGSASELRDAPIEVKLPFAGLRVVWIAWFGRGF